MRGSSGWSYSWLNLPNCVNRSGVQDHMDAIGIAQSWSPSEKVDVSPNAGLAVSLMQILPTV